MGDLIKRIKQKRSTVPAVYKPNHGLYGLLLAAAVVIALLAALIPQSNPLFSILIGVGSGGIASVIVAWLIDNSTCKQNNKKAEDTQKLIFSPIRSSIESAIEFFALQCIHSGNIQDFNCKKTWLDWMREACTAAKKDQEDLRLFCIQCCVLVTVSWNLPKFMSIESVMPPNHLTLCCSLLLLPSIFPSIRVFSNESRAMKVISWVKTEGSLFGVPVVLVILITG